MALDPSIPLQVKPFEMKSPIQGAAEALTLKNAQLENMKKQNDAVFGLVSGVTDQASYDIARQKASEMGLKADHLPQQYDPDLVKRLAYSSLEAKDMLELQLKEAKAAQGGGGFEYVGPDGSVIRISGNKPQVKEDVSNLTKAREGADAAATQSPVLERTAELLSTADSGFFAPERTLGRSIGADLNSLNDKNIDTLEANEELEGIAKQLGAIELEKYGGSDTNMDLRVAIESTLPPRARAGSKLNLIANKFAARDVLREKPIFEEQWRIQYGDTSTPNAQGQTFSQAWQQQQYDMYKEIGKKYREQLKNFKSSTPQPQSPTLGNPGIRSEGLLPPPQGMGYDQSTRGVQPPSLANAAPQKGPLPLPQDKAGLQPNKIYQTAKGLAVWNGSEFESVD